MATRMTSRRALACVAAATAVACAMVSTTRAQPLVWDGGGSDQFFGTANNWDLDQAPTSADDVSFPAQALPPTLTPNWEAADSVQSISVDNSGGYVWVLNRSGNNASPRSITIGSGGLTLTGGGTTNWGAVTTSPGVAQTWNIGTGTTLQFTSGATLGGSGKITKTGNGTINLFASSSGFSGGWDITAGKVSNAGGSATNIYGTGATSVSGTGILDLNILGGGAVSGGVITLANGGTLSGRTGVPATGEAGLSSITSGLAVDSTNNATVIIKATTSGETMRLTSAVTGGLGAGNSIIRIQGPGEVHLLNGTNSATSYSGTWKVESGGTLRPESNQALGFRNNANSAALELAGGTIRWAGTTSGSTAVTFTVPITVTADSTMTIDKQFAVSNTAANNSGSLARTLGALTIGGQTLTVNGSNVITGGTTAGANVRMGGGATTLTGNATFNVVNNITNNYGVEYVSGAITGGSNGYTKSGTGTMSVLAANSYSGPTNVSGGRLQVLNTGGLGTTSAITVGTGATLSLIAGGTNNFSSKADLSGNGLISLTGGSGNTFTAQGAAISPGASAGILSVTGNLALALDGGDRSALNIEVTGGGAVAGTDYDLLAVTGTVSGLSNADLFVNLSGVTQADMTGDILTIVTSSSNFTGLSFNSVNVSGGTADVNYGPGSITLSNITVAAVPEPASLAVLGLGGLLLAGRGRRRKPLA